MKYRHHQLEYEIADEWLIEAGVSNFKAFHECYRAKLSSPEETILIVAINSIEPLLERARLRGIFCDDEQTGDSAKQRVIRILRWFLEGQELEPVKIVKSDNADYEYRLVAGCHRLHCAHAMGYRSIPAVMGFDLNKMPSQ